MSSHFLPSSTKKSPASVTLKGGFGLIELMVSIGIMALVSAAILTRHSAFNSAVLLRSELYEVAFSVREVQLGAVSAESNGSGSFRSIDGLYFDTSSDSDYKIFRDADSDYYYDLSEQFGKQGKIDGRFQIRAIRAVGDTLSGTGLSVVFERPNFDAKFYDNGGVVNASSVEIDIARRGVSGNGPDVVRTLEITHTGQITVK
jgi:prepilin-type N-terminal cleavage/methylation domain-containing protein